MPVINGDSTAKIVHSNALLDENLSSSNKWINKLNIVEADNQKKVVTTGGPGKTFKVESATDLMSRLKSFLPKMSEANLAMREKIAEDPEAAAEFDIENVDECEKVVELDLNLVPDVDATPLHKFMVNAPEVAATAACSDVNIEVKLEPTVEN